MILMANNSSKTNANTVRQQNAQSAGQSQSQGQFGTEFASETDVQSVKQANAKAEQNKAKNSGNFGQQ